MTSGGRGPCSPTRDIAVQWRSQHGANGAPAPPDCRGPFLQIVHIRLDFWRGEGKLSHCLLGTDTGLSSLPGASVLTNLRSAAG